MRRRTLLAGVGTGITALAGCLGAIDDGTDAPRYELNVQSIGDTADLVTAQTWRPEDTPDDASRRDAWERATDGEAVETVGYAPLPDGEYTERDGRYFLLRRTVVGQRRVERPVLRLSWVGHADELENPPEATPANSLPEVDRRALTPAYFAARAREFEGGAPWDIIERGGSVYRTRVAESELVPESDHEHVRYQDTILRVRTATETFYDPVYETTARPVADGRAAFVDVVEGARLDARIDASALEGSERRILDTAGADGYEETEPLSEDYRRLIERLGLQELLYNGGASAENGLLLKLDERYYRYGLYIHSPQN